MTKLSEETIDSWRDTIRTSIPQLSINTVIFRFHKKKLQFAAVQLVRGNLWLIPGGYVYQDESVDDAARRNLYDQTQIDHLVLNQFGSFGSGDRRMKENTSGIEQIGMPEDVRDWITQRFVTIAYYSVIFDPDNEIKVSPLYERARWLNIDDEDELAMDHSTIVAEARKALAKDLLSQPLLLNIMPVEFTIPELQKLYEAILDRPIDRGNFRKRMLKSGFLMKTGQVKGNARQRPPELYHIDKESYLNSLTEDVKLGF
jgi:ADP-ribose pyrophosphatase YjhB (NUDIX family)